MGCLTVKLISYVPILTKHKSCQQEPLSLMAEIESLCDKSDIDNNNSCLVIRYCHDHQRQITGDQSVLYSISGSNKSPNVGSFYSDALIRIHISSNESV